MSLTVAFCSSRKDPKWEWFFDSLRRQPNSLSVSLIFVDLWKNERGKSPLAMPDRHVLPKPNVWNGEHRLTKDDCWAVSNARNTALCLCSTSYIIWLDDRCVLQHGWLEAAFEAMNGGYAVCGSYEKRVDMKVDNGIITEAGKVIGEDCRNEQSKGKKVRAPGQWFFGGTLGMPTEWALQINGFEELMDGLSAEDCMMGLHLQNNGFKIIHDPRLKIIEDRTPSELGQPMRRSSKEKHPNDTTDKGHEAFRRFGKLKRASHHWDLGNVRRHVLNGEPFPHHNGIPSIDWFDGKPIKDF